MLRSAKSLNKYRRLNMYSIEAKMISDGKRPSVHRFYDTPAISPSGRYVAYTTFMSDEILPKPGDIALVHVKDIETGATIFEYETCAWDTQLGAQVQWGKSDKVLLFNDMDKKEWQPFGLKVDPQTGNKSSLEAPIYMADQSGTWAISPCLKRISLTQRGYGVIVPKDQIPLYSVPSQQDGVFQTSLIDGTSKLLISTYEIVAKLPEISKETKGLNGDFVIFHTKWSPDSEKIMIVLRFANSSRRALTWLIVYNLKNEKFKVVLKPEEWIGGHHPNWCPDSEHIVMNVVMPLHRNYVRNIISKFFKIADRLGARLPNPGAELRLVKISCDRSSIELINKNAIGSGHPSFHPTLQGLITDAYEHEKVSYANGYAPIRWITHENEFELLQVKVKTKFNGPQNVWRIDPHPSWSREGDKFTFNGTHNGVRSVFLANFKNIEMEN